MIFQLQPASYYDLPAQREQLQKELDYCNQLTAPFGLSLSMEQMQTLFTCRFQALRATGRIEFGEGVLKKLVCAFCDSPYLQQSGYEEALIVLQELFYYLKKESRERLTDDEVIEIIRLSFHKAAHGSLEYLSSMDWRNLPHYAGNPESFLFEGGILEEGEFTDDE